MIACTLGFVHFIPVSCLVSFLATCLTAFFRPSGQATDYRWAIGSSKIKIHPWKLIGHHNYWDALMPFCPALHLLCRVLLSRMIITMRHTRATSSHCSLRNYPFNNKCEFFHKIFWETLCFKQFLFLKLYYLSVICFPQMNKWRKW